MIKIKKIQGLRYVGCIITSEEIVKHFDILCSSSQAMVMFTFRSIIHMAEWNVNITMAWDDDPCYHAITVQDPGVFNKMLLYDFLWV